MSDRASIEKSDNGGADLSVKRGPISTSGVTPTEISAPTVKGEVVPPTEVSVPNDLTSALADPVPNKYQEAQEALYESKPAKISSERARDLLLPTDKDAVWISCRASRQCSGNYSKVIHKEKVGWGLGMHTNLVKYQCLSCKGVFHVQF